MSSSSQIWVKGHYREPGEAKPHWILIHETSEPLKVLCGMRPMWWTEDLSKARFMFKRQAKRLAMEQFGSADWDGNVLELGGHEKLWLVRP